jgi:quercetin dioxygenase-like cupin family protein
LTPFSHDHHHGLVQARRLRLAAARQTADRREAAADFLTFFARDTRLHFREEEERLFPLLVGADDPGTELLTQALLEHQLLHALVHALERELGRGNAPATEMRQLARALERHIRFEERTLFPFIEDLITDEGVRRPDQPATRAPDGTTSPRSRPLWGTETEDLNATLLAWPPGAGPPEHVNSERDVLVVLVAGSATVVVDGEERFLETGEATTIEKGSTRRITAGPAGVRYLSVHTRRPPLQITPARRVGRETLGR